MKEIKIKTGYNYQYAICPYCGYIIKKECSENEFDIVCKHYMVEIEDEDVVVFDDTSKLDKILEKKKQIL